MDERDPLEALVALIAAIEVQTGLCRDLVDRSLAHGRRLDQLEEAYGETLLALGDLTRRSRLLVNMKAATLTQTCRKCGNEYAHEEGPELCGPCWVKLGKPDRYLATVDPPTAS